MAGSYNHIVDEDGKFRGTALIDNLGDAYEALEECYRMIQVLADGDKERIAWACENYSKGVEIGGTAFDKEEEEMSKLWFIKVNREIEDPYEMHVRQNEKPTEEQIKEWFEQDCTDDWNYIGRIECYEVTE